MNDSSLNDIFEKARLGRGITRDEARTLLALHPESDDARTLAACAESVGRMAARGTGLIYGQIGIDGRPCPADCRFCALASCNSEVDAGWAVNDDADVPLGELVRLARIMEGAGVNAISLMSTAALPIERLLAAVEAVRGAVSPDMALLVNGPDMDEAAARRLKAAGVQGAYHALRLEEGLSTALKPKRRLKTMAALKRAGLALMTGIEPLTEASDVEEILDIMEAALRLHPYSIGACSLTPIGGIAAQPSVLDGCSAAAGDGFAAGSPAPGNSATAKPSPASSDLRANCSAFGDAAEALGKNGLSAPSAPLPATRARTRQVAAVFRLMAKTDIPFGGVGGTAWVDAGTDPRNRGYGRSDDEIAERARAGRRNLEERGWFVPQGGMAEWFAQWEQDESASARRSLSLGERTPLPLANRPTPSLVHRTTLPPDDRASHQPVPEPTEHPKPDEAELRACCQNFSAIILALDPGTEPLAVPGDKAADDPLLCKSEVPTPRPFQFYEGQTLIERTMNMVLNCGFKDVAVLVDASLAEQMATLVPPEIAVISHSLAQDRRLTSVHGEAELFGLGYGVLAEARDRVCTRNASGAFILPCDCVRIGPRHVYEVADRALRCNGIDAVTSWIAWLNRPPYVLTRQFLEGLPDNLRAPLRLGADGATPFRPLPHLRVEEQVFGEELLQAVPAPTDGTAGFIGEVPLSALEAVRRCRQERAGKQGGSMPGSPLASHSAREKAALSFPARQNVTADSNRRTGEGFPFHAARPGEDASAGARRSQPSEKMEPDNAADRMVMEAARETLAALDRICAAEGPAFTAEVKRWDAWARRNRLDFPLLCNPDNRNRLAYLDSAATTQRVAGAIRAQYDFDARGNANIYRGAYQLSAKATGAFNEARAVLERHIGAKRRQTVYTMNTSTAIALAATAWGERNISVGDVIAVPAGEHHSNLLPWMMLAQRRGARLEYLPLDDAGRIDPDGYRRILAQKPKIVCIAHVGNVLGMVNPVAAMAQQAHSVGARILVDAAQSFAHLPIDVQALGCDFLAFSSHKAYGPLGLGGLWISPDAFDEMDPLVAGGGTISHVGHDSYYLRPASIQYELGTPPIAQALGFAAAIEYLDTLGMDNIAAHDAVLTRLAARALDAQEGVTLWGDHSENDGLAGLLSFSVAGLAPADAAKIMGALGVAVRSGGHCALPLRASMGVTGTTRMSFAAHTDLDDIAAGLTALKVAVGLSDPRRNEAKDDAVSAHYAAVARRAARASTAADPAPGIEPSRSCPIAVSTAADPAPLLSRIPSEPNAPSLLYVEDACESCGTAAASAGGNSRASCAPAAASAGDSCRASCARAASPESAGRDSREDCGSAQASAPADDDPFAGSEAQALYGADVLAGVPAAALAASRGCGDPVACARLQQGEKVIDLGSGGGIDAIIAARLVGPDGHVWGLDVTPDMVALARDNAREAALANIDFLEASIDNVPLADCCADAVISNCVVNLVEDKSAVFREIARLLAPGGRMVVSDIVAFSPLPDDAQDDLRALTGCRRGIPAMESYRAMLEAQGMVDVRFDIKTPYTHKVLAEKAARKGREQHLQALERRGFFDAAPAEAASRHADPLRDSGTSRATDASRAADGSDYADAPRSSGASRHADPFRSFDSLRSADAYDYADAPRPYSDAAQTEDAIAHNPSRHGSCRSGSATSFTEGNAAGNSIGDALLGSVIVTARKAGPNDETLAVG